MRRMLILFLSAGLVFVCFGDTISYIRFEENGGSVAADQTGLLDGELIQFGDTSPGGGDTGPRGWSVDVFASTIPLTGQPNNGSIRFAGGSEFIDLSNGLDLSLGTTFTIEFFLKSESPILQPMFGFSPVNQLYFLFADNAGELVFRGQFQDHIDQLIPATGVQPGMWYHFAMVKEPQEYSVYVDGNLLANPSLSNTLDGPYFFPGTDVTGDRTIGGNSGTWRGWLDEFRISDEALTPDQFLNYQIPEPSTILLLLIGGTALFSRRRCPYTG